MYICVSASENLVTIKIYIAVYLLSKCHIQLSSLFMALATNVMGEHEFSNEVHHEHLPKETEVTRVNKKTRF